MARILRGCVLLIAESVLQLTGRTGGGVMLWQNPGSRPSIGLDEIGLSMADAEFTLVSAGYTSRNSLDKATTQYCADSLPQRKMRLYETVASLRAPSSNIGIHCRDAATCLPMTGRSGTRALQKLRLRGWDTLKTSEKIALLDMHKPSAVQRLEQWRNLPSEHRDTEYNSAALSSTYKYCLQHWRSNGATFTDKCNMAKFLQGVEIGHIATVGKNSCLHPGTDSFLEVELQNGLEIRTTRPHKQLGSSGYSEIFLAIRGQIHLFRHQQGAEYYGEIAGDASQVNSLRRVVGYSTILSYYNSRIYSSMTLQEGIPLHIAGNKHVTEMNIDTAMQTLQRIK